MRTSTLCLSAALAACGGESSDAKESPLTGRITELSKYSFERVLTPEDIEAATVSFIHLADERDPLQNDLYRDDCRGVVLGIQDSQYVVFTTKCAVDFEWPQHDIRWRAFEYEDGPPELVNECLIFEGVSMNGGDEWFAYPTTETTADRVVRAVRGQTTWRSILPQAQEVGDIITFDFFENEKGALSDVALVYVPVRGDSTIRLKHLGLNRPKEALRELLANQSTIFGIEFEFSCPQCQEWVRGYESREKEAFLLGLGVGLASNFVRPLVSRLFQVDQALASGTPLADVKWDPEARLASTALRSTVLERDGSRCYYARLGMCDPDTCWACVAENLHIDHVVPFSKGGETVPDNLVTSCAACNLSKGAKLIGKWMAGESATR